MTTSESHQLTPAMLHILLAIAAGARHGYGIMKEVAERTDGGTELGAGTLYRSVGKMLEAGWIEEIESERDNPLGPRRREYALTDEGRRVAAGEVRQLHGLVRWARDAELVDPAELA